MKGLSPLVSMVLVIAFGFIAMAIVLAVVNPLLDRAKDSGIINEATQNMQLLDSAVKAVASEAKGSKRTVGIKITEGVLRSNSSNDQVYFEFEPKTETDLNGFAGDVKIESRPVFLEYFNQYSDGANANDSWTAINGTWSISSGRFLGTGGVAYKNVGNQSQFDLAAIVVHSSAPDGEVYAVPGDPRSLVLYLPFDGNINTTITTAYDYSAYKNNGTLKNVTAATCFTNNACPSWVSGKFGNATSYDGIGDYTEVTNDNSLKVTQVTIAGWINLNSFSNSPYLATKNQDIYGILFTTTGQVRLYITAASGTVDCRTSDSILTGSWYHVVGTYDSTSGARLYINGANQSLTGTCSSSGTISSSTNSLFVGSFSSSQSLLNGTIDEVMVFNRALTASEVAFLYESSIKKITTAVEIPAISNKENVTLVLASPGSSYFDNIKLKSGPSKIRFVIPYQNVDIVNNTRFGSGNHNIVIVNYGTNSTNNRRMVSLE